MNDLGMRFNGESKFAAIAKDLGEVVSGSKASAEDALVYLQFVGELGPAFYKPPREIFNKALTLAETRVSWEAEDKMKITRYESLRDMAKLYSFNDYALEYQRKIDSVGKNNSSRYPRGELAFGII